MRSYGSWLWVTRTLPHDTVEVGAGNPCAASNFSIQLLNSERRTDARIDAGPERLLLRILLRGPGATANGVLKNILEYSLETIATKSFQLTPTNRKKTENDRSKAAWLPGFGSHKENLARSNSQGERNRALRTLLSGGTKSPA